MRWLGNQLSNLGYLLRMDDPDKTAVKWFYRIMVTIWILLLVCSIASIVLAFIAKAAMKWKIISICSLPAVLLLILGCIFVCRDK